jgi:glycerophosphoryl diester phosphodiesterase
LCLAYLAVMKASKIFLLFLISGTVSAQIYIPKFDLQGHRGARGLKPENSIPGFILALDSGVTTIELDLAITKDKQIVVSHEPWMAANICTQPNGALIKEKDERKFNIYQMTYDQVLQFDCGSKGNPKFPQQEKVKTSKPLLQEVIIAVEDHIKSYSQYEVDYNIEIKSSPEDDDKFHPTPKEFSDLVFNLIDQYLPVDRVGISHATVL